MKYLIVFGVLLIICFTFCVKENSHGLGHSCDQITKTSITDPQLLLCKYKVNSTWVFQDTINKTYDTLKVIGTKSFFGFDLFQSKGCDSIEHLYIFFQNTDLNYNWSGIFFLDVLTYKVYLLGGGYGGYPNINKCVFLPNKINSNKYDYITHDSLFIVNKFYKNVCEWDTIQPMRDIKAQRFFGKMKIYFNPENGFLRSDVFGEKNKLISRKLLVSSNILK